MSLEQQAIDAVKSEFPGEMLDEGASCGQRWVEVRRDRVIDVLTMLRDRCQFEFLMDLTAVDWLNQGKRERFCVVYELYSLKNNEYFRVKTWVPEDDPELATASDVWKSAPWAEREVWDLFGIRFKGHRDLRRIVLPFDYTGHPLRKDYPLIGRGERQNFPRFYK